MSTKRTIIFCALALFAISAALGQAGSGLLTGSVVDRAGGVIPGAQVVVTQSETGWTRKALTNDRGVFSIPNIAAGEYVVTVEVPGFKKAVVQDVKVALGTTRTIQVTMEIGQVSDSVIVKGEQGLIERQSASISSVIEGRQITELPFTSRDTLDLALTQAGTASPGRPRQSTVNGLPKGALNITIDGLRVQSNFLRSSDGFFTYIRPRIDAIEEFSLTQAGQSADQSGEGAVQLKFVTKRGTNEWHGGAWWYHRNPVLNANYYFNNLTGTERQRQLLNQIGVKVGGPILRDKLFFFFTVDSFRLPQSISRTRTVLADEAYGGDFTYNVSGGGTNTVNVLQLAAGNGFESGLDPINSSLLEQIRSIVNSGAVQFQPDTNPLTDTVRFNNFASGERYFPTLRLDWDINQNWRWEGIWNYNYFNSNPDTLNGRDPTFPGAPQQGSQLSNRFSLTGAVRTSIGLDKTNEFRIGALGGTVEFFPELTPNSEFYPLIAVGGENTRYRPDFTLVSDYLQTEGGQLRNAPVWQISDNFNWSRGHHTYTFGVQYSLYDLWISNPAGSLLDVSFGVPSTDPAFDIFNTTTLPGANTSVLGDARTLYAMLTGRVSGASANIYTNLDTRQFELLTPDVDRLRQHELGIFFQDSWKLTRSLTFNYGLRWQMDGVFRDRQQKYTSTEGGAAVGVFGPSGLGNFFQPGNLPGQTTNFVLADGSGYDTDLNNWAPNVGLAWNPTFDGGFLEKIFGSRPVFRAGYSISYVNEGLNAGLNVLDQGPGFLGDADLIAEQDFEPGTVLTRNGLPPLTLTPPQAYDFPILATDRFRVFSLDAFDPNLRSGYVQSWSIGIQRELNESTILEFRYVGNKGTKLWQQWNTDSYPNIFENAFLAEFLLAQENQAINLANGIRSFANNGFPGQHNLPLFESIFSRSDFRSSTRNSWVSEGRVGDLASFAATSFSRFNRMLGNGLPENFFLVNPRLVSNGLMTNSGWSTYNALQVELRRRLTSGLLFQANYTWSHALSNLNAVASNVFAGPVDIRDFNYAFGPSPFNIYHAFKANWVYELPFGTGRRWASSNAVANKLMEGWQVNGILRAQSGRGFSFDQGGRGTVYGGDGGVDYQVNRRDIQNSFSIRQTPDGLVFWVPEGFVGGDNRANSSVFAQHTTPGTFGDFFWFEGPRFFRIDLTVAKKTYVSEGVNVEFRAEFLNAFNNINFLFGSSASAAGTDTPSIFSTSFGRITEAYRDTSTTNDLGGRMVQLVLRINF